MLICSIQSEPCNFYEFLTIFLSGKLSENTVLCVGFSLLLKISIPTQTFPVLNTDKPISEKSLLIHQKNKFVHFGVFSNQQKKLPRNKVCFWRSSKSVFQSCLLPFKGFVVTLDKQKHCSGDLFIFENITGTETNKVNTRKKYSIFF